MRYELIVLQHAKEFEFVFAPSYAAILFLRIVSKLILQKLLGLLDVITTGLKAFYKLL